MSEESRPYHVLFVCSGNSCRSPMAEGLLRLKLPQRLQDEVEVQSAGTLGIQGMAAAENSVRVVREFGGNISGHRSQGLSRKLVAASDLILAMASEHVEHLRKHYPAYRENVFLLKQFANPEPLDEPEIEDPIGSGLKVYRECGGIIADEIERILPAIVHLVQERRRETL